MRRPPLASCIWLLRNCASTPVKPAKGHPGDVDVPGFWKLNGDDERKRSSTLTINRRSCSSLGPRGGIARLNLPRRCGGERWERAAKGVATDSSSLNGRLLLVAPRDRVTASSNSFGKRLGCCSEGGSLICVSATALVGAKTRPTTDAADCVCSGSSLLPRLADNAKSLASLNTNADDHAVGQPFSIALPLLHLQGLPNGATTG